MSDDREIIEQIDQLVAEEHELENLDRLAAEEHARETRPGGEALPPPSEEERARLKALEVHLDQLWALRRQRRARGDAGLAPDGATERAPKVVERYRQ